ncbi:hypothetical protein FGG08_005391 [Glutinoglossum americanum]|uniref:Uncharacterized protein n=1 Tax=Glutinoglossum americanum TaxID=1670608 RepID=A0A9P8HYI9_9PEZI|nr:hypothetical protein FGG08_005391 [Glutinoglossum americanum]
MFTLVRRKELGGMRSSRIVATALALLFYHSVVTAFSFKRNVNFSACWVDEVQGLNVSNYSDPYQWWDWDVTHTNRTNQTHPQLSLLGCEKLCGDGYQLWPLSDTFLRLVIWVFPLVALIAHFHFAPLGAGNMVFVVFHLIGDPIDSMWSMLTRTEVNRRFYRRAIETGFDGREHIATIWAAYDELGWQEPTGYFLRNPQNRDTASSRPPSPEPRPSGGSTDVVVIVDRTTPQQAYRTASSSSADLSEPESSSASWIGAIFQKMTGWAWRLPREARVPQQYSEIYVGPTEAESFYIRLASHRLTSNRSESQLGTWFAILALLTSLAGAYIRTWTMQTNSQTSHTIAIVCLLFILLPLVKISGDIGCFTSPSAAVDILFELRRNLRILSVQEGNPRPPLFPPLSRGGNSWDSTTTSSQPREGSFETIEEASMLEHRTESEVVPEWPKRAPWMGMNSSWRPCKHIMTTGAHSTQDRGSGLLFVISALFAIVGYVPALLLAYFTPTVGFGCRSMAWTLILAAWTASVILDELSKSFVPSAKSLYYCTWVKDGVIFIFVIGTITAVQLGFFNNCYCITDALTLHGNAHADIGPQSTRDFNSGWKRWLSLPLTSLIILGIIFWAISISGGGGRTLLCKSQSDRQGELQALLNKRRQIPLIETGNTPNQIAHVASSASKPSVHRRRAGNSQSFAMDTLRPSAENSGTTLAAKHPSRSVSQDSSRPPP